MNTIPFKQGLVAASLLLLGACGGSSSDDENDNPDNPQLQAKISEDNAVEVVQTTFNSLNGLSYFDGFADFGGMKQKQASRSADQILIYCGEDPETDTGHGSMDLQLSGNFETSVSFDLDFDQCDLTETATADGHYGWDASGNFNIGPYAGDGSYTATLAMDQLSLSESETQTQVEYNGTGVEVQSYFEPVWSHSSTTNLAIDMSQAAVQNSINLTDWQQEIEYNTETGLMTLAMSGDFSSTLQDADFSVTTLEDLTFQAVASEDEFEPSVIISGKFKITADDNTSVTVTILNATQAQLEIDLDGNGSIDVTITVSVDELQIFESMERF